MKAKKILFAGDNYYPCGGWDDFIMSGTKQECLDKFQVLFFDWGQIVDHATLKLEIELKAYGLNNRNVEVKQINDIES